MKKLLFLLFSAGIYSCGPSAAERQAALGSVEDMYHIGDIVCVDTVKFVIIRDTRDWDGTWVLERMQLSSKDSEYQVSLREKYFNICP